MKLSLQAVLCSGAVLLGSVAAAPAQTVVTPARSAGVSTFTPYQQPAVSPYLNLARPGNAAANYYGLVRPQQATNQFLSQFRTQPVPLAPAATQPEAIPDIPTTGHPTGFFSHTRYFMTQGGTQASPTTLVPVVTPGPVTTGGTPGR